VRTVLAKAPQGLGEDVLTAARDEVDEANLGPYNRFLSYQRLRWLVSASKVEQVDRQGLLEALRQHGETDWDGLESSFSFTQYLIWLLPSIGFLGTVWGMTGALQAFSGSLGSQGDLSFNSGLINVTRQLGVAFHTTLVGLAAVIPLLAGGHGAAAPQPGAAGASGQVLPAPRRMRAVPWRCRRAERPESIVPRRCRRWWRNCRRPRRGRRPRTAGAAATGRCGLADPAPGRAPSPAAPVPAEAAPAAAAPPPAESSQPGPSHGAPSH
jgi:hypothetical protein